jgi:murein DD-endopeptidase MepM/ murein hydrolase activator NlpD
MAKKWTLVVVPPGSSASRVIEVSQRVLKASFGGAFLVAAVALLLGYGAVSRSLDLQRADELEHENQRIAEELGRMHGEIANLTDTLNAIATRDARIRLLANLEPNDPSVQQAGIGGPSAPGSQPDPGASVLTQRTDEVRVDLGALIRRANLLAASFNEAGDSLANHRDRLAAMPSIMPTAGGSPGIQRDAQHPILHVARPHQGIDVTAPMGAPILSPARGRVVSAGWETGYGQVIEIDHGFGIRTRFAHCSRLLARPGQVVDRGEKIAEVGNSGLATGPHLHYEVEVNGRPENPLRYVLPEAVVD